MPLRRKNRLLLDSDDEEVESENEHVGENGKQQNEKLVDMPSSENENEHSSENENSEEQVAPKRKRAKRNSSIIGKSNFRKKLFSNLQNFVAMKTQANRQLFP